MELGASGELIHHGGLSLFRAYASFALGGVAGVFIGLAVGSWVAVRHCFDPLVSFLYPVPKIAFLPIFLLLFGLGNGSQIAILSFATFFPIFSAARAAVLSINPNLLWAAANMGAGRWRILSRVMLPAAAPQIFSGLRIGLAHSFVLLFAAELIGGRSGLGFLISEGEETLRFDNMFAAITIFAALGYSSDRLLMAVRTRALRGQSIGTQEQLEALR